MDYKSPLDQFNDLRAANTSSDFLFIVFFRGHWCPFCISYLSTLSSLSSSIVAANGTPLIITSEPSSFLPETRKLTGYSVEAIVDEENELVKHFKEKGWVDVAVSEKKGYKHGMAQPAILVLKSDLADTVLESWAIVPGLMNLGGAKDRPDLGQVWENVQAKLKGGERVHGKYKLAGFFGMVKGKIFG